MEATQSHKLNVAILNRNLAKEAWYNTFWSKLAGFQGIDSDKTNGIKQYNPAPNVVIQMVRDFISEGRDNLIMPMLLDLTEPGVYGDAQLLGTGEDMSLKYHQIYINQSRKAVTKLSGHMANQRLKIYNMMEKAKPALVTWWAKTENQAIFQSFYEGASPNVTAGTNDQGLGLSVRFHPNWYYQSTTDGTLTTLGTAKYTKTASDLTSLTSANIGAMTAKTLNGLNELITGQLLIEPIVYDSEPFWLLIVNPRTFKKLKQDTTIKADQNAAFNTKMMAHPAISGKQMLYYDGFCIIPDSIGARLLPTGASDPLTQLAGGDLQKGWLKPSPTSYAISNSLLVGKNAMGKGLADSLQFTEEESDHGNVIEIGSRMIAGYNRADFFSESDSANAFAKNNASKTVLASAYETINQSSMILSTED